MPTVFKSNMARNQVNWLFLLAFHSEIPFQINSQSIKGITNIKVEELNGIIIFSWLVVGLRCRSSFLFESFATLKALVVGP